ncbi:hypothetical protein QJQ45_023155, partial [Haematococcus lacustris]
ILEHSKCTSRLSQVCGAQLLTAANGLGGRIAPPCALANRWRPSKALHLQALRRAPASVACMPTALPTKANRSWAGFSPKWQWHSHAHIAAHAVSKRSHGNLMRLVSLWCAAQAVRSSTSLQPPCCLYCCICLQITWVGLARRDGLCTPPLPPALPPRHSKPMMCFQYGSKTLSKSCERMRRTARLTMS